MPSFIEIYHHSVLYLLLIGGFYLIVFIFTAFASSFAGELKGVPYGLRVVRRLFFLVSLLASGLIFELIWQHAVWGRLYTSTDYVFDFLPYIPITQARIDRVFGNAKGELISITMNQLRVIWLMFAISAWATTWAFYRCFKKFGSVRV